MTTTTGDPGPAAPTRSETAASDGAAPERIMDPVSAGLAMLATSLGAAACGLADVADIIFRLEFRKLCEANRCGSFNKGWMCPPAVGGIEELAAALQTRSKALVFTSLGRLRSGFDIKGMKAAGEAFATLVQGLAREVRRTVAERHRALVLGAGPCKVCARCAYQDGEPCRDPESAVMSLEANGVDVSQLAKLTGLKYNNGPSTVTYFGAVFLNP